MFEWGKSPWGQDIPIHISFFLLWVSAIGGLLFLIVHAIWIRYFDTPDVYAETTPPGAAALSSAQVHSDRTSSIAPLHTKRLLPPLRTMTDMRRRKKSNGISSIFR